MLTIFQVFTRHLWLVVTILNSTDCRTFPSSQKVLLLYVALSLFTSVYDNDRKSHLGCTHHVLDSVKSQVEHVEMEAQ